MSINDKRKQLFISYRINNNKEALKQLVLTFIPSVEKIVQKYDLSIQDTLNCIAIEATIDCINNFDFENSINNLILYVNKYINSRIQSYLKKESKNHIEFESLLFRNTKIKIWI